MSFTFQEVVKRNPQAVFVATLDASGHFSITVPCYYAQDFVVRYEDLGTSLLCAPGNCSGFFTTPRQSGNRLPVVHGRFPEKHQSSAWFNRFIDDYLSYATWQALLSYLDWHARQNNLKREDVVLPKDYYGFLRRYNMDATDPISMTHAAFLYPHYVFD